MKNWMKYGALIAGLTLFLTGIFIGVTYFQKVPSTKSPDLADGQKSPKKSNSVLGDFFKPEPKIVTASKSVGVIFSGTNKLYPYNDVPLYKVTYKDDQPIEITANGDLAKTLVDNLPPPDEATEPEPAKVKNLGSNLQKLIRGEEGIGIDKEKTLQALENAIKLMSDAATLTVPIELKTYSGPEGFEGKRKQMGFTTLISTFKTSHDGHKDDHNRNINLAIAAQKIDGLIIPPNSKFSFDKVVGMRIAKNGFKKAGVISQGKVIPGMGGGVCQVSTTLYRSVLQSGLKIIERHNHSIYDGIEYADRGLDSAIAWGYKDLKFVNNLDFPILVSAKAGEGTVEVSLFAEKKPFEEVILETRNEVKHPFKIQTKRNGKLKKGTKNIVHPGVTGYTVEAYRIIKNGGKVKEERLSKDRYLTFNRIEEINN